MKKRTVFTCLLSAALIATPFLWKTGVKPVRAEENDSVAVDETNFPDAAFREYITKHFDENGDDILTQDEIENADKIEFPLEENMDPKVKSLKGIELFPNLTSLTCGYQEITELDVSKNTKLNYIYVSGNQLKTLDLSSNPQIEFVSASNNEITELKFGNCESLTYLELPSNKLTSLDISGAKNLEALDVGTNKLTVLDISSNTKLSELRCGDNDIAELNVSGCANLAVLECDGNRLTKLDVSNNPAIMTLECSGNLLSEVDFTNLTSLTLLSIEDNKEITRLPLAKSAPLTFLGCSGLSLTELDASGYPKLESLYCENNQLTELDLSGDTSLQYLNCKNNQITKLDASECEQLFYMYCNSNKLTELKVNSERLCTLHANDNALTNLDIRNCDYLVEVVEKNGIELSADKKYYEVYDVEEDVPDRKILCLRFDLTVDLVSFELPNPNPSFAEFVERLYTIALDRESDPEGKQFWVDQVENKGATGADCARFFLLEAPEFMERKLTNEEFLNTLYRVFFDREGDPEGLDFYLKALKNGATKQYVVECFIESKEWVEVCERFGVESGAKNPDLNKPSPKIYAFVERLYENCLFRGSDKEGLEYWVNALASGQATGIQAARFFCNSDEMKKADLDDRNFLMRLYMTFFDRASDRAGEVFWEDQMKSGMTREAVVDHFAMSKEFGEICDDYGIVRGEA